MSPREGRTLTFVGTFFFFGSSSLARYIRHLYAIHDIITARCGKKCGDQFTRATIPTVTRAYVMIKLRTAILHKYQILIYIYIWYCTHYVYMGPPICYTRTYCIHLYIYYSYVLHIIFIILKFIVCIYLCQLNRGLRGQVVFPGPSCSRGVLRRPPAAGCVYMPVLFTHARAHA